MNSAARWVYFLGILFLLMGIYGFLRIAHVSLRGVPYPSAGVLPSNILFDRMNTYSGLGRESDCEPYPALYYQEDNKTLREATEQERVIEQKIVERCIQGFNEERAKTKQYDRNLSAFLVFVGAGLIFSRRFVE